MLVGSLGEVGFAPNCLLTSACTSLGLYPAFVKRLVLSCPFPHAPLITSLAISTTVFLAGCGRVGSTGLDVPFNPNLSTMPFTIACAISFLCS